MLATKSFENSFVHSYSTCIRFEWQNPRLSSVVSGSQLSFLTEEFAKKLGLNQQAMHMPISGIAQGNFEAKNSMVITIQSRVNAYRAQLNCVILPKITQRLPQRFIHSSQFKIPANIPLADPNFTIPGDIDLLIGAELFWQLCCIGQIKECRDHPTLQKTKLGWVLSGHVANSQKGAKGALCYLTTMDELNKTVSKLWQVENNYSNDTTPLSVEERECEKSFQENTIRDEEGRFVVKLPTKENVISQLGDSKEIAERRFFALERRLLGQPDIYEEYRKFMSEYQTLNHMHQVSDTTESNNSIRYYLPHHAVLKDSSTTTRLRVVFDASCKTESGKSLNDALLVDPIIQQDLFSILACFRTFRVAITADIAKIDRCSLIHRNDLFNPFFGGILRRTN